MMCMSHVWGERNHAVVTGVSCAVDGYTAENIYHASRFGIPIRAFRMSRLARPNESV